MRARVDACGLYDRGNRIVICNGRILMSGFELRFAAALAAMAQRPRPIRPATAAALLATTALFGATNAWGACSPATGPGSPSNTTVTCSGTTTNQDNPNG